MTEEEAITKLREIGPGDPEAAHGDADDILIEFLRTNGHSDVAHEWVAASDRCGGFWYA